MINVTYRLIVSKNLTGEAMQEDIFFNPHIDHKIEKNLVFLVNNVNKITVKIPMKIYTTLEKLLSLGISKQQILCTESPMLKNTLETLFFYDVLLTLKESRLLECHPLKKPSRLSIEINPIPDTKIKQWCLFGAPVDFAMDPPRSPMHGPYIIRSLTKNIGKLRDIGDVILSSKDNIESFGSKISYVLSKLLMKNNRALMVGGDHSVTYYSIKEHLKKYPDMILVQFDAHSDINALELKNSPLNHANFISKLVSECNVDRVIQVGVRERTSNYQDGYLEQKNIIQLSGLLKKDLDNMLSIIKNKFVYITFDMDVLDPSIFPHVTTPLMGGLNFGTAINIIKAIKQESKYLVGCDVVEFTCGFDRQGNYFNDESELLDTLIYELTN